MYCRNCMKSTESHNGSNGRLFTNLNPAQETTGHTRANRLNETNKQASNATSNLNEPPRRLTSPLSTIYGRRGAGCVCAVLVGGLRHELRCVRFQSSSTDDGHGLPATDAVGLGLGVPVAFHGVPVRWSLSSIRPRLRCRSVAT